MNWPWNRDRWEYRVDMPQHSWYYIGGTVRPRNGSFIWEVYQNRQKQIPASSGVSASLEEAKNQIEQHYTTEV